MRIIKFMGVAKRRFIVIKILIILFLVSGGMVNGQYTGCAGPPYFCESFFQDDPAQCEDPAGVADDCRVGCSTCAVVRLACYIFNILYGIAGFVGAVLIVSAGVKWATSGDNARARDEAKEAVIHTIVGLIIVTLAVTIVLLIYTSGQGVADTNCIGGL